MRPTWWQHTRTGGLYEYLHAAQLESDGTAVIVYRSLETGDVWVRPKVEFLERFNSLDGLLVQARLENLGKENPSPSQTAD